MRLADRVRRTLEREILSGQLPAGTKLDEVRLAERFEVSRTPIREALMQLSSSGLILTKARQGAQVAQLSAKRIVEMFEVMSELESLCARLAARRMTNAECKELTALQAQCRPHRENGDKDGYYLANNAFHDAIYAGSHNRFLEEETRRIRERLSPYRRMQLQRPGRLQDSHNEHEGVVEAILKGDSDLAAQRMSGHVAIQGDIFADLLLSIRTEDEVS